MRIPDCKEAAGRWRRFFCKAGSAAGVWLGSVAPIAVLTGSFASGSGKVALGGLPRFGGAPRCALGTLAEVLVFLVAIVLNPWNGAFVYDRVYDTRSHGSQLLEKIPMHPIANDHDPSAADKIELTGMMHCQTPLTGIPPSAYAQPQHQQDGCYPFCPLHQSSLVRGSPYCA